MLIGNELRQEIFGTYPLHQWMFVQHAVFRSSEQLEYVRVVLQEQVEETPPFVIHDVVCFIVELLDLSGSVKQPFGQHKNAFVIGIRGSRMQSVSPAPADTFQEQVLVGRV